MARAATKTLLSLDRFAELIGMHPLHFNQVEINSGDIAPIRNCGSPIAQYGWQYADRIGREEVAQIIAEAESILSNYLGFDLLPTWQVQYRAGAFGGINSRGHWQAIQTTKGYVISGGVEAKTLIDDAVAIVYSDDDGDSYNETATISVATTVTNIEEIAVYYPGESGVDEWEIRPIKVSISGGIATITCKREQLVKPELFMSLNDNRAVNGLDNTNFLTTVDVYRHYNDPQTQIQFMWEPSANCITCTTCDSCVSCTYTTQNGCLFVRNSRLGLVAASPASWNATTSVFDSAEFSGCRVPDTALLSYRAGYRDMNLRMPSKTMASKYEHAIARLAVTLLHRPMCGCPTIEKSVSYWRDDLAERHSTQGGSWTHNLSRKLLDCPFGTSRGALYAWQTVKDDAIGHAAIGR